MKTHKCTFWLVCYLLSNLGLELTSNEDPFPNTNMQNQTNEKHLTDKTKSIFFKINAD